MTALDLVSLTALLQVTGGRPEVIAGLIDGPVAINHPDLMSGNIREVAGTMRGVCAGASSVDCQHGTFVAGILSAKRGSEAPAICPDCTLLVRPIFAETASGDAQMPSASPPELATAIVETVHACTRVNNLSAALVQPSAKGKHELAVAQDHSLTTCDTE